MSIAEKLTYLKRERRLTTEEISQHTGVPVGTLNKILSGQTKNPAVAGLDKVARVLRVPIRFLLDDTVPPECNISAYSSACGMIPLSAAEVQTLELYRALPEHERRAVDMVIRTFSSGSTCLDGTQPMRKLPCYVAISHGQRGVFGDAFLLKQILVVQDAISKQCDFSVQLCTDCMRPVYAPGTVLLCKYGRVEHDQLGVFTLNREAFIRRLYQKRGVTKLVPPGTDYKDIVVQETDELRTLGLILGAARSFRWA